MDLNFYTFLYTLSLSDRLLRIAKGKTRKHCQYLFTTLASFVSQISKSFLVKIFDSKISSPSQSARRSSLSDQRLYGIQRNPKSRCNRNDHLNASKCNTQMQYMNAIPEWQVNSRLRDKHFLFGRYLSVTSHFFGLKTFERLLLALNFQLRNCSRLEFSISLLRF